MEYEDFRQTTRLALATSFIALQAHQKMIEGRGAPTEADMLAYIDEAEGLTELYDEAIEKIIGERVKRNG